MLKYKVGDLLKGFKDGDVNVIAHGCNTYCTMGNGIAPQIKKAFPQAYEADLKTGKGDRNKLGKFTYALVEQGHVFNLYSQHGFWGRNKGLRDLDYNALYDAMVEMKLFLEYHTERPVGGYRIGLPKIGAGLAGGDWNVIEAMIKSVFFDCDVTVYLLG